VASDVVVDAQELFADALGVSVEDAVADVVAQCADVGDVVVEAFEFEQRGLRCAWGATGSRRASSTARQNARVCPAAVSPLIRSTSSMACSGRRPLNFPFQSFVDEPEPRLEIEDGLADD